MTEAKRLTCFALRFRGPHTPETFQATHIVPDYFDHVIVGTGASRAVAAKRAVAHLDGLNLGPVIKDIEAQVTRVTPRSGDESEAQDRYLCMYCIIGICVEREAA